jgi:hypothetical protein
LCIGFALNIIRAIGQRRDKCTPKLLVGRKLAVKKQSVIELFTLVAAVGGGCMAMDSNRITKHPRSATQKKNDFTTL